MLKWILLLQIVFFMEYRTWSGLTVSSNSRGGTCDPADAVQNKTPAEYLPVGKWVWL